METLIRCKIKIIMEEQVLISITTMEEVIYLLLLVCLELIITMLEEIYSLMLVAWVE